MRLWLAFLLSWVSFVCATAQTKDKYEQIIDTFKRTGQGEKLIPWFVKELKGKPRNEEALKSLGSLYFEKNDLDNGEKYYGEALKVNARCARCYMSLGIASAIRKENKKALNYFNRALDIDPRDAYIYSVRANLNALMGNRQEALFDFNSAVYLDPQNAYYYVQRGAFNGKDGFYYLALGDLNKAVELGPQNYVAFFQRADLYFGQKMFKEAIDDISTAIRLDSTRAFLFSSRGNYYSGINEFQKAIADYTSAIKLDPQDFRMPFNRALCHFAMEDMDAYCADIHDSYELLTRYAPADTMKGQLEHTLAIYCDPAKENYYYHRGIALFNQQQYTKAIEIYDQAIKQFPGNSLFYSFRANTFLMLKDYPHAIADYNESVKNKGNILNDLRETSIGALSPDTYVTGLFATTQLSLAQANFALGKYEEALADINKGIEMAPQMKEFGKENYYNLRGIILITVGRQQEAIPDFDKCVELNPNFEIAFVNRAVAKVSVSNSEALSAYTIKSDMSNLAFNVNWSLPEKKPRKNDKDNIMSALVDCNRAIQLNAKDDYAYYVRGRLEKLLGYGNYCPDLLKAKAMGFPVEQKFMTDCGE